MSVKVKKIGEISSGDQLGEGVQWHEATQSLWWTDILGQRLCVYDWNSKTLKKIEMPDAVGSFAFTLDPSTLIVAFKPGFAFYNIVTGAVDWIAQPPFLHGEGRFNDGRVDRQGRFWAGTMMADPNGKLPPVSRLFCCDLDQNIVAHIENVCISNGLCWSPDGQTLYFADSPTGEIVRYDFHEQTGSLSNRRIFAKSCGNGGPDGAGIDSDGTLWSARWGASKVLAYNPGGDIVADIAIPASQPTCVAFGGPDLNLLFVTSAKDGLSKDQLEKEPSAGNVFVYETNVTGLPEQIYLGDVF